MKNTTKTRGNGQKWQSRKNIENGGRSAGRKRIFRLGKKARKKTKLVGLFMSSKACSRQPSEDSLQPTIHAGFPTWPVPQAQSNHLPHFPSMHAARQVQAAFPFLFPPAGLEPLHDWMARLPRVLPLAASCLPPPPPPAREREREKEKPTVRLRPSMAARPALICVFLHREKIPLSQTPPKSQLFRFPLPGSRWLPVPGTSGPLQALCSLQKGWGWKEKNASRSVSGDPKAQFQPNS